MKYFIIEKGEKQQSGPYSLDELNKKGITSETLVWSDGLDDWTPAWKIEELRPILDGTYKPTESNDTAADGQPAGMPPIPESVLQQAANSGQYPGNEQQDNNTNIPPKTDKKKIWTIVAIVVFLLLCVMTCSNPDKDTHVKAINEEINDAVPKMIDSGDNDDPIMQGIKAISKMLIGDVTRPVLDSLLDYHNYLLWSKTTVSIDNKDKTVSYGFLGNVWTIDSDDIIRAMETGSNSVTGKDKELQSDDENTEQQQNDQQQNDQQNSNILDPSGEKSNEKDNNGEDVTDKIAQRVGDKVADKINKKIDEVADTGTIERVVDKIISLFK